MRFGRFEKGKCMRTVIVSVVVLLEALSISSALAGAAPEPEEILKRVDEVRHMLEIDRDGKWTRISLKKAA